MLTKKPWVHKIIIDSSIINAVVVMLMPVHIVDVLHVTCGV